MDAEHEDGDELSAMRQEFAELSEEHERLKKGATKDRGYAAHERHRARLQALIDRLQRFRDSLNR